ncbi:hypothetical protein Hypma_003404 [Hypsizygus marmoreus]|uniref:Uncharacterized protein n=1 Tax=Hypsizygus marmoreus TaxID=39966 RepID=A0A369J4L3_HYPMA|nr:hypothetical protein Hypma_003404 [Hypsizygus marmoreus]
MSNAAILPSSNNDPRSPQAISKTFKLFKSQVQAFQKEMGELLKECRPLGRSYALIVAAQTLREKMRDILAQFHENAKHLSPHLGKPRQLEIRAHIKLFATKLEDVANAFENLRKCLDAFQVYTEESAKVRNVISQFRTDLRVSTQLQAYSTLADLQRCSIARVQSILMAGVPDKFDEDNLRHYIHGIATEMGEDLDALTSDFKFFNDYGMPAIQYEQKRDAESVLNMSTVATFFSAVTATTLQMSIGIEPRTNILSIVNTFWFCSLVLSIGAALGSLLHVSWKRTTYGSRGQQLPIWMSVWIHASAPVFLAVSIVCFMAGLALFTYASNQAGFTQVCTLITTGVTSFGLLNVSCWVAYEQLVIPFLVKKRWAQFRIVNGNLRLESTVGFDNTPKVDSISDNSDTSSQSDSSSLSTQPPTPQSHRRPLTRVFGPLLSFAPLRRLPDPEIPTSIPLQPGETAREDAVDRWNKSPVIAATVSSATKLWEGPVIGPPRMEPLPFTFGEVQDMEFSPSGQLLAITCFDTNIFCSTTMIYTMPINRKSRPRGYHHSEYLSLGKVPAIARQVAWYFGYDRLLVRYDASIHIVSADAKLLNIIKRPHRITSAAWCYQRKEITYSGWCVILAQIPPGPGTDSTLLVVKAKYPFPRLLLRDIAVVPMTDLLLVIGRVTVFSDGRPPKKDRAEKQIIVYNLATGEIKSCNPVVDDVRYITLSNRYSEARKGFGVLLGHKDKLPPRLWTLEIDFSDFYNPLLKWDPFHFQSPSYLAGRGYFAGDQDHTIVCAGVDGDIHIWDRESGEEVKCIQQALPASSGMSRSMAWSPWSSDSLTFVTAERNVLKVWSISRPNPADQDAPGGSPSDGGQQVLISRKDVEDNKLADQYTS